MAEFISPTLSAIADSQPDLIDAVREKFARRDFGDFTGKVSDSVNASLESFAGQHPGGARFETIPQREGLTTEGMTGRAVMEAIVERVIRPPLFVQNGTFVPIAESATVPQVTAVIKDLKRDKIDPAIALTARVEFGNVPGLQYVGTGWIVEKPRDDTAIIVTNRHVAREFASADGRGSYPIRLLPNFREYEVRLDFLVEHNIQKQRRAAVRRVLFIAGEGAADIALMEIEGDIAHEAKPIDMATGTVREGQQIGVIGYPAYDSRHDRPNMSADLHAYFGDVFGVKRFAFGNVTGVSGAYPEFTHDASTLPGNSGSIVIDRDTGESVGLHFAGEILSANYAVPIEEVKAALAGLKPKSVVVSKVATEAAGDGRSQVASFVGRDGFDPTFLSTAAPIAPPRAGDTWQGDLADVDDADTGMKTKELKYRHFSVWMSASRKLPLLTAVNIDGAAAKRLGRIDKWYIDGRLGDELQVDNSGYKGNPLDRGHMVRREDPVWGDLDAAAQANQDTFHYTNAAPQHEALNQKDWLRLEDYVLGNAKTQGVKVSVFTGPVFAEDDPLYRDLVRIPRAFWKIVAIINSETGKPSVTGYLLSQGDLIKGITGEFVYGAFRTYQVEVAEIGRLARIDVAHLIEHDPLPGQRHNEGLEGNAGRFVTVSGVADLVL